MDAVVYLRFLEMCRNIFIVIAVLAAIIILPINVIYNRKSPKASTLSTSDVFILTTPILITGKVTIAHVVLAYLFDFIVFYFLSTNYKHLIERRKEVVLNEECQNSLFRRTLLITEIPRECASNDMQLWYLMEGLDRSRPPQNAAMGRNVSQLTKDIKSYNKHVLQLESVLSKFSKNLSNESSLRPTIRRFKGDVKFSEIGQKTDAISYHFSNIQRLIKSISEERKNISAMKTLTYGIVSYKNVQDCNAIAAEFADGEFQSMDYNATLAPRLEAIIWENIAISKDARQTKQLWGNIFFLALTVLWIGPNAFLGAFLSQMSRIGVLWPAFARFIDEYPILFSILQGIGAPLVTGLIFLVMPAIMRKMTHWQGNITKHDRELSVTRKLYCFFVFNNILIFTLFSVVWAIIVQIIEVAKTEESLTFSNVINKISISYKISTAIMGASSFWIMYILRINVGAVLDLLQLFSLIWRGFQRHFMSPTPRQQMLWTAPQHFAYASYYTWLLFYSTIALSFTVVQPIVGLVVAFYFSLDILYKKYGLMYIFVTKTESDGLFWPLLADSFLFATAFGNLSLFAVVFAQGGWRIAFGMGPLFLILLYFKFEIQEKYRKDFSFFPRSGELRNPQYGPPTRTPRQRYQNPVTDSNLMVPIVHDKVKDLLPEILGTNYNAEGIELNQEAPFLGFNQGIELTNIPYPNNPNRYGFDPDPYCVRNQGVDLEIQEAIRQNVMENLKVQINNILRFVSDQNLDYAYLKLLEPIRDFVSSNVDTFNDEAIAQAMGQEEGTAYYNANSYSGPGGPSTTNNGNHRSIPVSYAGVASLNGYPPDTVQREAGIIYGQPNTEGFPVRSFGNEGYGEYQDSAHLLANTGEFQSIDLHGHGGLEASHNQGNLLNGRESQHPQPGNEIDRDGNALYNGFARYGNPNNNPYGQR